MIRRALVALLALQPSPAIPQAVEAEVPVPLVMCRQTFGYATGSAFRIGPHLLLSVKHVTNMKNCAINGVATHVLYTSRKADFSILSDERTGEWLRIDCNGFVAGHRYVAVGHVRGMDKLTAVPMIATGQSVNGMALLAGIFTAQPGMSGGAVLDAETLKVVGTVNAANWEQGFTASTELKRTPVCGSDLA